MSLIVANLAVIVTHVYRLIRNGEDIDHSSYDVSTGEPRRIKAPLKGFLKTHISSMHFARGADGSTSMGTDTMLQSSMDPRTMSGSHPSDKTFGSVFEMSKFEEQEQKPRSLVDEPIVFASKSDDVEAHY